MLITPFKLTEYREPVARPVIELNGNEIEPLLMANANAVNVGVPVNVNAVCPVEIVPPESTYMNDGADPTILINADELPDATPSI